MGVLGGSQTVEGKDCKRIEEEGKHICKFTEKDENDNVQKQGIFEADLDENGNPISVSGEKVEGVGDVDEWSEQKKNKLKEIAQEESSGGITSGNTEF